MNKETPLAINLIAGGIIFVAGFYMMLDHLSFIAAVLLMATGIFMMCMSGWGYKQIDKRTNNGIRYTKN